MSHISPLSSFTLCPVRSEETKTKHTKYVFRLRAVSLTLLKLSPSVCSLWWIFVFVCLWGELNFFYFPLPPSGYSCSSATLTVFLFFTPSVMEEGCVLLPALTFLNEALYHYVFKPQGENDPVFSGVRLQPAIEVYKNTVDEGYFCVLGLYIPQ